MSDVHLMILFITALLLLIASGVWVGISLLIGACLAMVMFTDIPFWDSFALDMWSVSSSWTLSALPLFILMGEILSRTRLGDNLFRGLAPWCRSLPGGLMHVNVAGSSFFATITGSSAATVATVGRITLPELDKRGYARQRVIGTLCGAGTLGLLIPPSVTMIVYGVIANVSVADLFIAGIIPGIVLAIVFSAYIALTSKADKGASTDTSELHIGKLKGLLLLTPVLVLMVCVIGSIYTGIATPTEAAAVGVFGALMIAVGQRTFNLRMLMDATKDAVAVTSMIMLILTASSVITLAMGYTGIPAALASSITALELSKPELILALACFYIVLGCFLDGISMITLTMAIIQPLLKTYGIDLIWYGIFMIIVVEMAQITPPLGINLFVIRGMTGHSIGYIARAAVPMFFLMILVLVLIYLVPSLVTYLPAISRG